MRRNAQKRKLPDPFIHRRKKSRPDLATLATQYRATLPRLAEIAAMAPGPQTPSAIVNGEEAALLLTHERLIAEATTQKARTLDDIRCKLELWRLEAVGADGEPGTMTDALVVSVISDLKRLIKRLARDD